MNKIWLLLLVLCGTLFSGNVTVTLVGIDPLTINIKGNSTDEEAATINIYLYYRDDGTTDLTTGNVNASAIESVFGWGSGFPLIKQIDTGSYSKGGHTFTRMLTYSHADLAGGNDDYWTTSGINAIICDFSPVGSGHAYVEVIGADGLADFSGIGHNVSYVNRDASLPVQMSNMEAESTVDGIELMWETASEVSSLGFHIWRSNAEDGDYERITTSLIAGQGNSSSGATYNFTDKNYEANATYYYRIEQVDADGGSEMFSTIEVTALFIPTEYALSQNYPNPFNPMTTFTYDVPEVSDVTIRVYSLLGKEVRTLYSKQRMPGRYTEVWDGTDNTGRKLASGVYFLRMQTGSFSKLRKMTLIR
jgi:hypothetical protein